MNRFIERAIGAVAVLGGTATAVGSARVVVGPVFEMAGAPLLSEDSFLGVSSRLLLCVVMVLGGYIFRTGAQLAAPTGEELLRKDARKPVLLLRSFADDSLAVHRSDSGPVILASYLNMTRWHKNTFEETLADLFANVGPVIAIGEPGQNERPLGAARVNLDPANWQLELTAWLPRAQLVVLVIGRTQGLLWELDTIVEHDRLEDLLLVVPPVAGEDIKARWAATHEALEHAGIQDLPESLPEGTVAIKVTSERRAMFIQPTILVPQGEGRSELYRDVLAHMIPGIRSRVKHALHMFGDQLLLWIVSSAIVMLVVLVVVAIVT